MVMAVSGCKTDDLKDDVNDLKDRVTLLEEQVKILNDNVEVLAYVLNPDNKTISSAEYSDNDKTAIIITLSNGEKLTLTVGNPGEIKEPVVTIKDGYWFINGEPTGKKAEGVDGENGGIPQFRVYGGSWQVRYVNGNGEIVVDWTNVTNGQVFEENVDMYDSVFKDVTFTTDKITLVLTDDTSYELPIVADLICEIDDAEVGDDGCFEFQNGDIKTFKVKIQSEGTPLAPVYPAGWRAELEPLEQADGAYNYQLIVYAPSGASTLTRAAVTADNKSEISIRANKGVFWAVDKIKVRLPYSNNLDSFKAGALKVNGYKVTMETLGITDSDVYTVSSSTQITKSGVYIVNTKDTELTYKNGQNKIDNVVILPYTDDIRIKLKVQNQVYLNKNFICKNVDITYEASSSYVLRLQSAGVNIIMDDCSVVGLVSGSGFVMPQSNDTQYSIDKFSVKNSNFNINSTVYGGPTAGYSSTNLVNNMDCKVFEFVNNIIYRSVSLTESINLNFKILNAQNRNVTSLIFNNNTIIRLESTTTAMLYAKQYEAIEINNNIFWNDEMAANSSFIRFASNMTDTSKGNGANNIGNAKGGNFKVCYEDTKKGIICPESIVNNQSDFTKTDIFNTSDSNKFNTTTGVFVPKDAYKSYGAQR